MRRSLAGCLPSCLLWQTILPVETICCAYLGENPDGRLESLLLFFTILFGFIKVITLFQIVHRSGASEPMT